MSQLVTLVFLLVATSCWGQSLDLAVASNFTVTARALSTDFRRLSGHKINLIPGSTGKHYAQIVNGAPFDIFLAADSQRPLLLEQNGVAVSGSRFSYAFGRLVLWSRDPVLVGADGGVLTKGTFRRLAIANPKLAPYGRAAQQVLDKLQPNNASGSSLLRGENISQAFQFVHGGEAQLGLVALSQLLALAKGNIDDMPGSWWLVPPTLYEPIEQQAVQLSDSAAATEFMLYLKSDAAQKIIKAHGYLLSTGQQDL